MQKIWKRNWFNENKISSCNQFPVSVYNFRTTIINWLFTKNPNSNPKMISPFEWKNLRRRLKRLKAGFIRFGNPSRNDNLGNLKRGHRLTNRENRHLKNFAALQWWAFFFFFFPFSLFSWRCYGNHWIKFVLTQTMHSREFITPERSSK